jgi:hypothetical protein
MKKKEIKKLLSNYFCFVTNFCETIQQTLVVVVGHPSSILNFSYHIVDSLPAYGLTRIEIVKVFLDEVAASKPV